MRGSGSTWSAHPASATINTKSHFIAPNSLVDPDLGRHRRIALGALVLQALGGGIVLAGLMPDSGNRLRGLSQPLLCLAG